jgi:hypothetical protein
VRTAGGILTIASRDGGQKAWRMIRPLIGTHHARIELMETNQHRSEEHAQKSGDEKKGQ